MWLPQIHCNSWSVPEAVNQLPNLNPGSFASPRMGMENRDALASRPLTCEYRLHSGEPSSFEL